MQITHCLWAHQTPPAFCVEWAPELDAWTPKDELIRPGDTLTEISFQFAVLLHAFDLKSIPPDEALATVDELDARLAQWAIDTHNTDERLRFRPVDVLDSPNVWNNMVHVYSSMSATGLWNKYRSTRLMVNRKRENLSYLLQLSADERLAQQSHLLAIRGHLSDEICACIPLQLGRLESNTVSEGGLVTAYNSIWPLFFAGQSVLQLVRILSRERYGDTRAGPSERDHHALVAAVAQLDWIRQQFYFIAHNIGLRWATSIAALLQDRHGGPE